MIKTITTYQKQNWLIWLIMVNINVMRFETLFIFHILRIMIPTGFHIFRGVETSNQKIIQICFSVWILGQFG